jgi:hypothetical protein
MATFLDQKQARVTARYDQGHSREPRFVHTLPGQAVHPVFQKHGMDVTFQVVHAYQRFSQGEGKGFAIDKADQERPDQAWSLRYRHAIHLPYSDLRALAGHVDDGLDIAQMLA